MGRFENPMSLYGQPKTEQKTTGGDAGWKGFAAALSVLVDMLMLCLT